MGALMWPTSFTLILLKLARMCPALKAPNGAIDFLCHTTRPIPLMPEHRHYHQFGVPSSFLPSQAPTKASCTISLYSSLVPSHSPPPFWKTEHPMLSVTSKPESTTRSAHSDLQSPTIDNYGKVLLFLRTVCENRLALTRWHWFWEMSNRSLSTTRGDSDWRPRGRSVNLWRPFWWPGCGNRRCLSCSRWTVRSINEGRKVKGSASYSTNCQWEVENTDIGKEFHILA